MQNNRLQREIGLVRATKHYLISIEGLPSAKVHDILVNEDGKRALVTALSHDAIEAMLLDQVEVRPGQQFEIHPQTNQLSIGEHLFGRVLNALGDPIDNKGSFPPKNKPLVLEHESGDLASRDAIREQLVTGFSMIDTVLPIGKGQRQLLMGSVRSGTENFCRNVIVNQGDSGMVCIYATIGKPSSYVRRLVSEVLTEKTKEYSIVIASTSDDPAPLSTIAPSVALYIAECFCNEGRDVLLVFDDLYTHAKYLREIALLEGQLPGRESYPGDIFFRQAHLIERAGNFVGKGSITLLPLLQTDIESTTDLIMTNIMGTTDGHFAFAPELFARGIFPPVLEEESVTRVGKHTQSIVQKQLSTAIVSLLADAKEQERYTQFGTQVSESTQSVIKMGASLRALLNQSETERLSIEVQAILLSLVFTSLSTDNDATFFVKNYQDLSKFIASDKSLAPLRKRVHTEESFDSFLAAVEKQSASFTKICRN
jgi:F-type H+/Na+-transporting ATPase subunit alpha